MNGPVLAGPDTAGASRAAFVLLYQELVGDQFAQPRFVLRQIRGQARA